MMHLEESTKALLRNPIFRWPNALLEGIPGPRTAGPDIQHHGKCCPLHAWAVLFYSDQSKDSRFHLSLAHTLRSIHNQDD
jgi:hypothetical protein